MLLKDLLAGVPGVLETRGNMVVDIEALITDSREKTTNGLFFCISGMRFDAHAFASQAADNGCSALVVERFTPAGIPQVRVDNVRSAMAYVAANFYGHPERGMRMVGVSGTKGKTTTSYLMKAILEKAGFKTGLIGTTGNLIGEKHITSNMTTPDPIDLHRCLRQMRDEGVEAVSMEVSAHAIDMHRLDGVTFEAACFTNFSQDHLDYFGTMENYINCKKLVYKNQVGSDVCILNADDPRTVALRDEPHCKVMYFSRTQDIIEGALVKRNDIVVRIGRRDIPIMRVDEVKIPGPHNLENALAAILAAYLMGVKPKVIRRAVMAFSGVEHRIETVRTLHGVTFINDSKATNPDSTIKAIQAMTKPTVLILGGSNKNSDYMPMFRAFTKYIQSIVVLGETSEQILSAARKAGFISVHRAYTFEEAVTLAQQLASPGMNVLLSPACASFDMFDNFEQRGEVFKRIVMELN